MPLTEIKPTNFPVLSAPKIEALKSRALKELVSPKTAVRIVPQVLPKDLTILAGPLQKFALARASVVTFLDDDPQANWGHACRYALSDGEGDGTPYAVIDAMFPPHVLEGKLPILEVHRPELTEVRPRIEAKLPSRAVVERAREVLTKIPGLKLRTARRFALLFSGHSNARHLNDLEYLYRTLVDLYGYDPGDITVLNHDGTLNHDDSPTVSLNAWPGDGSAYRIRVDGAGTAAAFDAALDALKGKLRAGDSLLIHTNNHGGLDSTSNTAYLCTREVNGTWGAYWPSNLGAKLAALPKFTELVVMMEQCFSGGFSQTVLDKTTATRTSFASAVPWNKPSYGNANFDFFAEDWISAVTGFDSLRAPLVFNPDSDQSGEVLINEAYGYANDSRTRHSGDAPTYADKPSGCGAQMSLGQRLPPDALDVAAWGPNRLDVFVRGTDAAMHHKWWDGARWSGWEPQYGGLRSAPEVVAWGANRLDVFVVGTDDGMYHKWWDGSRWSEWENHGGKLTSPPEVVAWASGRLDVFARGTDGALWHKWFDGAWHPWESLGGQLASAPRVVSWGPGRLDIFVRGTDGALWHRWFDGAWGGWESLGGQITGQPAAVSWAPGRLDIFARGTDRALWHQWFQGSWGSWESLGGELISAPNACAWGPGRLDILALGTDRAVWHRWFEGGWGAWESLGGGLISTPEVVAWGPGRLDIFGVGLDQALWHQWFQGGWGSWESLGGIIR